MSDLVSDGMIRVDWVATIAIPSAPTTTELTAGTRLDKFITPDGLKTDASTAAVNTSALSSTFTTNAAGRRSYDIGLTCKRTTDPDGGEAAATLIYRAEGFLVVRRDKTADTAYATGDVLEVYPVQCGEPSPKYGENAVQTFEVPMMLTADASKEATVAA